MKKSWRQAVFLAMLSLPLIAFFDPAHPPNAADASDPVDETWRGLPVTSYLDAAKTIRYCQFEAAHHSKVFLLVMPLQNKACELIPSVSDGNQSTTTQVGKAHALAGVNGAYFNLRGGLSASYVTIDGHEICNPRENPLLTGNPKLKPHLETIFNRSELRILVDRKGTVSAAIQLHGEPVPAGLTLKHSLQAGPRLLPELKAKEEAFLRTEPDGSVTDSIGCLKTAGRTACGITPDQHCLILSISGPKQDEFSSGMTLAEVAALLKKLGCDQAINFDGGTSTTMVVKSGQGLSMVCGREPETLVKSCLLLKKLP